TFNALTREWQSAELLEALERAGIPSGPINTYPEVFENEQVRQRGLVFEAEHVQGGPVRFCASPIRFTGLSTRDPMAPPILGQHTDEVLREVLGLDEGEISRLRERKIV